MSEVTHALSTQIHLPSFDMYGAMIFNPSYWKATIELLLCWLPFIAPGVWYPPSKRGRSPLPGIPKQQWIEKNRSYTVNHGGFKASSEDDVETRTADSQPPSMFQRYRYPFCNTVAPKWPTCRDQVLERVLLSTSTCCRTLRNPMAQCLGQYLESVEGKSATWIHMVVHKSCLFWSGCRINTKWALEDIWSLHKPNINAASAIRARSGVWDPMC